MSEEPTKDIGQKYGTQPTIETVVQMLGEMREEIRAGFQAVNARLDKIDRKIKILNDDVLSIRADIAGVDQRVTNLEESRA